MTTYWILSRHRRHKRPKKPRTTHSDFVARLSNSNGIGIVEADLH